MTVARCQACLSGERAALPVARVVLLASKHGTNYLATVAEGTASGKNIIPAGPQRGGIDEYYPMIAGALPIDHFLVREKLCLTGSTMRETVRVDKKPKARRNGGVEGRQSGARLALRLPNWYDCSSNSFVYLFLILRTFRHACRASGQGGMAQYLCQSFHFWLYSDGFSVSRVNKTQIRNRQSEIFLNLLHVGRQQREGN